LPRASRILSYITLTNTNHYFRHRNHVWRCRYPSCRPGRVCWRRRRSQRSA
jgi:hypothetical protein